MKKFFHRPLAPVLAIVITVTAGHGVLAEGIQAPLEIKASAPMVDAGGQVLPGSNPAAQTFSLPYVTGAVVQIIDVGPNSLPDLPGADGMPAGDDSLLLTTSVGEGIPPDQTLSGRFALSSYPPPAEGTRLYARVFNDHTVTNSTAWGQSAVYTVEACCPMDVSRLGLWGTSLPKGGDPYTDDSDLDGFTDYEELVSNTNAGDGDDLHETYMYLDRGEVSLLGRAGRRYLLMCTTNELSGGELEWNQVDAVGPLTVDQSIFLADPTPPEDADTVAYRVDVTWP